jgi:hypothetical protein
MHAFALINFVPTLKAIVYNFIKFSYNYMSFRNLSIAAVLLFLTSCGSTEEVVQSDSKSTFKAVTVAFYNLENLFDTEDDPDKRDEASPIMEMPESERGEVYKQKVKNMARVLADIGTDVAGAPPVLIGVAEIENRKVLEDVVNDPRLRGYDYGIEHFEGPDSRSIDVALLYMKSHFDVIHSKAHPLIMKNNDGERIYTRDQLAVTGLLDGDEITLIVNHWPSRRGGEAKSRPLREKAAALNMQIIDSIHRKDAFAKIITMGDLNDDPTNTSVKEVLKAQKDIAQVREQMIYNPMEQMFDDGYNTLAYRDAGNLFDQIMLTYGFLNKAGQDGWQYYRAGIFNPTYMVNRKGAYKNYPFRSFVGSNFTGGFSDHFPVYVYLVREMSVTE